MLKNFLGRRKQKTVPKTPPPERKSSDSLKENEAQPVEGGVVKEEWTINYDDLEFAEEIGSGAFGTVFRGDYYGTVVAIKRLNAANNLQQEHLNKYIQREVALLKGIHHPNIVQFMGLCKHESGTYLVTEFVAGGNLKDFLERNDPPWKMRVVMAMDIAVALNFMHKKGLVYRDIKPENLLLTENGRIKVCDLGLARTQNKMNYMTIAGSDDYMAPEVLLGEKYDEKCDVFGFGVLLGVIVARKKMPMRKEKTHYAFDLRAVEKLIPPGCPPRLKQLVIDCCKSNPNDRPDFKEALNIIRDIQKEVDLEDSRGDRGRSASVTQYNPYDRAGERDRAYTVSAYGAGYEQPPLPPSVVKDDSGYEYQSQGSDASSGQASSDNYAFFKNGY